MGRGIKSILDFFSFRDILNAITIYNQVCNKSLSGQISCGFKNLVKLEARMQQKTHPPGHLADFLLIPKADLKISLVFERPFLQKI